MLSFTSRRRPGVAASVFASALLFACACQPSDGAPAPAASGSAAAPAVDPNARVVAVTANEKGFTPSTISAKKGESLILRFTRTHQSECIKAIEFPSLKVKKDLPMNTPVDVPIKAEGPGEIKFQCWMAMLFGKVVVE
jgi:plastocyanin domain-containing protein